VAGTLADGQPARQVKPPSGVPGEVSEAQSASVVQVLLHVFVIEALQTPVDAMEKLRQLRPVSHSDVWEQTPDAGNSGGPHAAKPSSASVTAKRNGVLMSSPEPSPSLATRAAQQMRAPAQGADVPLRWSRRCAPDATF
jgi:hypothetical protein